MLKLTALALIAATLTGCAMMGGNVYPPQPDWAQEAFQRQQDAGSL